MADPSYIVDGVLTDGEAWVALNSKTLGSNTASITFTSGYNDAGSNVGGVQAWDQYMDLITIAYWRSTRADSLDIPWYSLNGNTTAGDYAMQMFYGDGSNDAAESRGDGSRSMGSYMATEDHGDNIFSVTISTWFDVNSGKYKSSIHQNACNLDGSGFVGMVTSTWKKQEAITSIMFTPESYDLLAASRIDLFGILPRMVA